MYIVAVGWIYVVLLMSFTETSFFSGLMTFLGYGAIPILLFLWIGGVINRGARRSGRMADKMPNDPDRSDTQANQ